MRGCPGLTDALFVLHQGSCSCQNNASWCCMYSGTTVFQVFTLKRAYVSPRTLSTKKRADMRKRNLCHVAHGLLGLIRTLLGSLSASGPRTDWLTSWLQINSHPVVPELWLLLFRRKFNRTDGGSRVLRTDLCSSPKALLIT